MKRLKRFVKALVIILSLYFTFTFITPFSSYLRNRGIENQINYLVQQTDAGNQLQQEYPEGFIFFNALLALSIIEHSENDTTNRTKYGGYVDTLVKNLLSEQAKKPFPKNQSLEHGAFYNGWVNYTLKKYVESSLIESSEIKEFILEKYIEISDAIAHSQYRYIKVLDSYPGSNWPADNIVCAISLPSKHQELTKLWIEVMKSYSTSALINHDSGDLSKVRGSSQSLMIYLLSQFDHDLADKDHKYFKKYFIDNFLGIQFVHEDIDDPSFSDVDSGPIILGYGSVSTIVNAKALKGINQRSKITEGFLNALGLPINIAGQKYYLFQQERMFDVFMLWVQVEE